jgi:hypothetical protein
MACQIRVLMQAKITAEFNSIDVKPVYGAGIGRAEVY